MRYLAVAFVLGCGGSSTPPKSEPTAKLAPAAADTLCITKGDVAVANDRTRIEQSVVRGFARGTSGDAAALDFVYRGKTEVAVPLASGDVRAQVGLKLRAEDGCNLVYVMWRIEPKPEIVVQIKSNPGKHTHEECGANGYTRVKATKSAKVFPPVPGTTHRMWAEIDGDSLVAWMDERIVWQGTLPDGASKLHGPAGFRTDNVQADVLLLVAQDPNAPAEKCPGAKPDD